MNTDLELGGDKYLAQISKYIVDHAKYESEQKKHCYDKVKISRRQEINLGVLFSK